MKPCYATDRIPGIYMFTNPVNGKKYIGQSMNVYNRFYRQREAEARNDMVLGAAFRKYGFETFDWEFIERMVEATRDQLNTREQYWILHHRSIEKEYGYNRVLPLNCETKKKISRENIAKANVPGKKNGFKGKQHTSYNKLTLSNINRQRKWSAEEKQEISDRQMGQDNHFFGKHHKKESLDQANHSRFLRRFFDPKPHYMAVYLKVVRLTDQNVEYSLIHDFAESHHVDRKTIHKRIKEGVFIDGYRVTLASKEEIEALCEKQRRTNMASIVGTPTYW